MDNVCYPETLGKMLVINAPWLAVNAWSMVRGWLDPRTVAKIEIIGPAESISRLHELVDREHIPPMYGGTGPDLYFPKVTLALALALTLTLILILTLTLTLTLALTLTLILTLTLTLTLTDLYVPKAHTEFALVPRGGELIKIVELPANR